METIMIIEDDRRIREELSLLLISAGYTALAVTEFTEEPIKLLKENHPDLILMDINIPGGSGVSLCAQIRKISQVPVIFVTGRTGAMDELEALMTGGDDYITKPYQAPVLLKLLHYLFSRQGEIVSREEIIDALWDQHVFLDDNGLSVNITRIRNKLKALGAGPVIETKRGLGYLL